MNKLLSALIAVAFAGLSLTAMAADAPAADSAKPAASAPAKHHKMAKHHHKAKKAKKAKKAEKKADEAAPAAKSSGWRAKKQGFVPAFCFVAGGKQSP